VHEAGGVYLVLDRSNENIRVYASYNKRDARTEAAYRNNHNADGDGVKS
jgi:hypothetical protein